MMRGMCWRILSMNFAFLSLCFSIAAASNVLNSQKTSTYSIIESQANFGARFFLEFVRNYGGQRNIVVSPLSVYMALAMLRVGAVKRTKLQIEQTMALPIVEDIELQLSNFAHILSAENRTVNVANKIWQQKYFCLVQCRKFTAEIQKKFFADLEEVNFVVNPKEAARLINRWASVASCGRIEKLIDKTEVQRTTRFVLTNMLYFKANWEHVFDLDKTKQRPFTVLDQGKRTSKLVDTMFVNAQFRYTLEDHLEYHLLELPYTNKNFAMIIILPHTNRGINTLEKSVNLTTLNSMVNHIKNRLKAGVEVFMPKFCVSAGASLHEVLKSMGLKDVFDPSLADLSNISGFRGMYVSNIRHKAFIKVTEHGTEAAGGTSITTGDLFIPPVFRIDRPFMFFIRHAPTNSIVFIGKILDPSVQNCNT